MDFPKYQLRVVSKTSAKVFRIGYGDQRRFTWSVCAKVMLSDVSITTIDGAAPSTGLIEFCIEAIGLLEQTRKHNKSAYNAISRMGMLAEQTSNLGVKMDDSLFEMLIWTEAGLRNALIANKGMAKLSSDNREKYILQGLHLLSEGKPAEAEEQFLTAKSYPGNKANVFNFLATALSGQGKHMSAATAMDEAVRNSPKKVGFIFRAIELHLMATNKKKAVVYIERLSKNTDLEKDKIILLSNFALRSGLAELGLELAKKAVEKGEWEEATFGHLINAADAYAGENKVFPLIRKYVNSLPKASHLRQWWLRTLIYDGALVEAEKGAQKWVELDVESGPGWFQLGRVYIAMGKPRQALKALGTATYLAPEVAYAHKLIADAYISLDDPVQAAKASATACKMQPENSHFIQQSKWVNALLKLKEQ